MKIPTPRIHEAVNWNRQEDEFTEMFWAQNTRQFWLDTEFIPSKDIKDWSRLSEEERTAYKSNLGGLTLLDTKQATIGMPKILDHVNALQRKSVLAYMGMMEGIHAKSYSTIFTTLLETNEEIDDVFEWVRRNGYLQNKAEIISQYYENINNKLSLYLAMVASVYLESFLFYSGFFYPLYLAGQGKMVASGEIINLIIRDESIHGQYIGLLAQELYEELNDDEKDYADKEVELLLKELMDNEYKYTEEVYSPIGLDYEVKDFLLYNANNALMNLGKEPIYEGVKINPIVENGLKTESKTHDFFSTKGNSYTKAIVEELRDEDFIFKNL
ncbi:class 1b ribonucleoside-diphosphate reductase subunit beta [Virgibacillus sp. M23]|uniref:class 1b ribonucleoside-diphosphate reductase subunit beta n=1 Tax=Virgibacillus sp. M23 TaxID=3079030 RepID=UPI002A9092DD|nr:class 1b ribonucleoside-diphosphate reductase subunit beta [Virgibacillus sp. M23]MDY7043717.1 class 1b ribonucleoside-diphosphate reductase subunit beta [Virgibacillus sp. M23]